MEIESSSSFLKGNESDQRVTSPTSHYTLFTTNTSDQNSS